MTVADQHSARIETALSHLTPSTAYILAQDVPWPGDGLLLVNLQLLLGTLYAKVSVHRVRPEQQNALLMLHACLNPRSLEAVLLTLSHRNTSCRTHPHPHRIDLCPWMNPSSYVASTFGGQQIEVSGVEVRSAVYQEGVGIGMRERSMSDSAIIGCSLAC